MKILNSKIKKENGRDTYCATPVVMRMPSSYRSDCESAMVLVGVEHRLTSTYEQDVEVAIAELLQNFVQVRRVLITLRRRDDALVVHRLVMEDMISVRGADVPPAIELALFQRTGVGATRWNCRCLDRGIEAIILPPNQTLLRRAVGDDLVCRHCVSRKLHGVLPPLKVQISSSHRANNDYRSMIPIMLKPIISDHKSQEAASAASWGCLKNFSFLLLQNMVRADVFLRVLLRF